MARPTRSEDPGEEEEEAKAAEFFWGSMCDGGTGLITSLGVREVVFAISIDCVVSRSPLACSRLSSWSSSHSNFRRARSFFMPPSPAYGFVSFTTAGFPFGLTFRPNRSTCLSSCMSIKWEPRRDLNMSGRPDDEAVMDDDESVLFERRRVGSSGVL